jgi:hypothetical protein
MTTYWYDVNLIDRTHNSVEGSDSVIATDRADAIRQAAVDYGWPTSRINARRTRKGNTLLDPVTP